MARQRYTSARTCRSQVPALHRALLRARVWKPGDVNADIGGGRFDKTTEELRRAQVANIVYDPYNRSDEHNEQALEALRKGTTTATIANVICVIAEPEVRAEVVALAAQTAPVAFFDVYEGNGSGIGGETRDGWQENRKLDTYVDEIAPFFSQVEIRRIAGQRVIVASC